MLISLHLPKTAGSSFLQSLREYFGHCLFLDYGDRPINTPALHRRSQAFFRCLVNAASGFDGIECIHGHFLPLKYRLVAKLKHGKFVTWIRDPVDRLASNYEFFKTSPLPEKAGELRKRIVEENWTLERFCLGPEMRNLYSQFMWGFSLERFEFIGITEYYQQDFSYFTRTYLGVSMPERKINVSDNKKHHLRVNDPALRSKIEAFHDQDMELYRMALKMRLARCETAVEP